MGIYKANSFNPITSIQAGLREATERGKLAGDKHRADADFWKGVTEIGQKFADDMNKVGLNAYDMYAEQNDTPEAKLASLEAELAEAKYNEQVRQRNDVNDYLEAERINGIQDKYNSQVSQRKAVNQYLMDPYNRIQPTVTEPWDGYNDIDVEDNLYRKALNGGIYA